jgi:hypothetical protein
MHYKPLQYHDDHDFQRLPPLSSPSPINIKMAVERSEDFRSDITGLIFCDVIQSQVQKYENKEM